MALIVACLFSRRTRHGRARGQPTHARRTAAPRAERRTEESVPMSQLRRRIAERLVQAKQDAALLTTFNEIDMSSVIALRNKYRDSFRDKYEVKLGFMSLFVKAAVEALKLIPEVNAEIPRDQIVYGKFFDIGVAVGGGKPPQAGGTSRRNVYHQQWRYHGSLFSTPIINPP
jgi:2-oxoglutarate dehydrogenase E2 component (dihydrolipoamide succinyltransferase)